MAAATSSRIGVSTISRHADTITSTPRLSTSGSPAWELRRISRAAADISAERTASVPLSTIANARSGKNKSAEPRSVRWGSKNIKTAKTHRAAYAATAATRMGVSTVRYTAFRSAARPAARKTRNAISSGRPPDHNSQV